MKRFLITAMLTTAIMSSNVYAAECGNNIICNQFPCIECDEDNCCQILNDCDDIADIITNYLKENNCLINKPNVIPTETTTQITTAKPVITTEITTQTPVIKPTTEAATETTTQTTTAKPIETTTQTTTAKPIETTTQTTTAEPIETTTQTTTVKLTETTTEATTETTTVTTTSSSSYAQKVLELVNNERAAAGLNPLTLSSEVSNVAQIKAEDMMNNNYFSHTSPTYGTPFQMMQTFGINYNYAGENIAKGQKTPEAVVEAWMNSEGHRANILNANFTEMGVGYISGNSTYWVQMFVG